MTTLLVFIIFVVSLLLLPLAYTQWVSSRMLVWLNAWSSPATTIQLEDEFGSTVYLALAELEEGGLVERIDIGKQRLAFQITPRGRDVVESKHYPL